jgi:hypothetical protein
MNLNRHAMLLLATFALTSAPLQSAEPPLDGLAAWYKADAGVTTNDAGGVIAWADQSGNANDAFQSDYTKTPRFDLNAANNQPGLHFDGINDFLDVLDSPTLENFGDISTFAVVRFDDYASYRSVWGKTLINKPASTDWYFAKNSGLPVTYRGDGAKDVQSVAGTKAPKTGSYVVVGFNMYGTTLTHYLNGTPNGSGEITSYLYDAATNLKIGSRDDFGTMMKGEITELLIYYIALTDDDIQNVTTYLRDKYGIVNVPPSVAVSSPDGSAPVEAGTEMAVSVTAADEDGTIARVDLFGNGTLLGSAIAPPFTFRVGVNSPGNLALTAVATDDKDGAATSGIVNVTITSSAPVPTLNSSSRLKLWLSGDQVVTNETGSITTWTDQSGNGNDALQDPLFSPVLTNLNGHPAAYFNGIDSFMDVPDSDSISITGDIASFFVARFEDFGGYRAIMGKTFSNQPRPLDYYLLPNSGIPRVFRGYTTNDEAGAEVLVNASVDGARAPAGNPVVLGFQQSGTNMSQYMNGQVTGTGTIPFTAQDFDTPLRIGSRDDLQTHMKGEIAELLLYDAALAPEDLQNVRDYLAYKYGIPQVLPTNSAPSIALTNVADGATFTTPTNLTLSASASDPDGAISQVRFFANGALIASDTSQPYSANLDIPAASDISLILIATDNHGLNSTSTVVNITATAAEPSPIPTDGLVLWLKADKGVSEMDGVVGEWQDFSGKFNDAHQIEAANSPLLVTNVLNGKPILRFDGVDDSLSIAGSPSLALTSDMTTFFVVKIDDASTYPVVWAKTSGNLARPFDFYLAPDTGIPKVFRGGAGGYDTIDALAGPALGEFAMLGWDVNGTNLTHYLNGSANGTGTLNAVATDEGAPLTIGTRGDSYTRLKGDLAEIVIYNRSLSDTERTGVQGYLNAKYALGGVIAQPPAIAVSTGNNDTLIFSWPSADPDYVLQSSDSLAPDSWSDVTEAVVPNGDQNTITVTTTDAARFFRLIKLAQ